MHEIVDCEVCGNQDLNSVLDLGLHPMCDDLIPIGSKLKCREYPIEILFCNNCKTAHQRYQVPKEILFPQSYHYRSRNTLDVLMGMKSLVSSCENYFGELSGKKVLDIGCNDGSLLNFFKLKGAITFGIEPTGAYQDAISSGSLVLHDYLNKESAEKFMLQYGHPDLITFTNVFAHIENLNEVLDSLRILSGPRTYILIENHYLGAIFERKQFDTFYHEHPRTYSYNSFVKIAEKLNMSINSVEFPSRYGGNIRVLIGPYANSTNNIDATSSLIGIEKRFVESFSILNKQIDDWKSKKFVEIIRATEKFGPLTTKAFPGRAAIPIKILGLNSDHIQAVYEKPASAKIGNYVPGTKIPILSDECMMSNHIAGSPILNLAWHIDKEIEIYMKTLGFNGEFINII
jgi:2-polyprenyl-3-methyl-5-hydroxy-6-metoxy-1,4-benzoquinol methylase